MKKCFSVLLVAVGWLGIDFCLAQNPPQNSDPANPSEANDRTYAAAAIAPDRLEKGLAGYLLALQCKNEGVVESALMNLIKMKSQYPDLDYSRIIERLQYMQEQGQSRGLRFLAFFTLSYLQNPENLNWLLDRYAELTQNADYLSGILWK